MDVDFLVAGGVTVARSDAKLCLPLPQWCQGRIFVFRFLSLKTCNGMTGGSSQ
jgi:hypothetical protein